MLKRQSFFAAAFALLLGCGVDLDLDNPAPPGSAPTGSGAAASDSGGSAGSGGTGSTGPAPTTPPDPTAPPGTTPPGAPAAVTHTVQLINIAFVEPVVTINVGDTVVWHNADNSDHTTTSDATGWSANLPKAGVDFKRTFTTAGTFPYHCNLHKSTMKGTVIVVP